MAQRNPSRSKQAKVPASRVTVSEYANLHGLSLQTVYRYIWQGKLPKERIGKFYVLPPDQKPSLAGGAA